MKPEIIKSIPLFSPLPEEEINNLSRTFIVKEYPAQAVVMEEGHSGDFMLYILEGKVEILKAFGTADEKQMAVVPSGVFLGEMSLFSLDHRHTASVRALEPLKLLEIGRQDFDALLKRQPQVAYEMIRLISRRLEDTNDLTISGLKEKNRQLERAYNELKAAQAQIIEKEKLERELEIARKIQKSILSECPTGNIGFECGALMVPARMVGGDFYSFIPFNQDQLGIVVGDVSDKGVPAAFFMALTYSLITAEASLGKSPKDTLQQVNQHLLTMNASNMFVTLLYGILDFPTGEFKYARAGHLVPVVLAGDGKPIDIPMDLGQPLGLFDTPVMDQQNVLIPNGGMALIFSDGLSEAADAQGREFGELGLKKTVFDVRERSAQKICDHLWESVHTYCGDSPQQDDFTVITLKRA